MHRAEAYLLRETGETSETTRNVRTVDNVETGEYDRREGGIMLTSHQLAEQLNISASTIRAYARERLIPFVETPGGHRRFDLDDVRAALMLVRPRAPEPLRDDEEPRLSDAPYPGFEPVRDWNAITQADVADAEAAEQAPQRLEIPMIGEPGSARFVVGQGAHV